MIKDNFTEGHNNLLILKHQTVEPRSQDLWRVLTGNKAITWQTVWNTSLSTTLSIGCENDVAWELSHRCLKTLDYVKGSGL